MNNAGPLSLDVYRESIKISDLTIELEILKDTDAVINYYADRHSDNIDMIPYYAELWPSAIALAKYLVESGQCFSGSRIIELGCGLGLPSLVAAKKGASVIATDFHPHNEQFLKRNLVLNQVASVSYRALDWACPPPDLHGDILIGSDLLYDERNIDILVNCSDRLCAGDGKIIIADPGRRHLQTAVLRFHERGFQDVLHAVDDIFIIELKRRRG